MIFDKEQQEKIRDLADMMDKYSESTLRASDAHKTLINEIQKSESMRRKQIETSEKLRKLRKRTRAAALVLRAEQAKSDKEKIKAEKDLEKLYGKSYDKIDEYERGQITRRKNSADSWQDLATEVGNYTKELNKLASINFAGLNKNQESLYKNLKSKDLPKSMSELTAQYMDLLKAQNEYLKRSGKETIKLPSIEEASRTTFLGAAKNLEETLMEPSERIVDSLLKEYENAGNDMERMDILNKALDVEGASKKLKQLEESWKIGSKEIKAGSLNFYTGAGRAIGGGLKSLAKGDQSGVKQQADQLREWSMAAKASGKKLGFLGKGLGKLSKGLAALGKMNWIFAIISAVVSAIKKMVTLFNELDKYVSGLNQEFLKLAGPAGALESTGYSMQEFNRAIHDLQRNVELGLMPEEIQSFFGAISGSGMSLQGVMRSIGDYGDIIEESRRMSLEFGVSMEEMGKMVGTQMLELRSSLSDVSEAFGKISYDAAIAGVSSNKFYNAIESTALSLEFYGNSLKFVSGLLTDIKETGRIGFKGAENLAKTYTEMFKGMGLSDKIALISKVGEDEMRDIFEEIGQRSEQRLQSLNDQISVMTAEGKNLTEQDEKRLKALKEQQKRLQDQTSYYKEIAESGNRIRMAQALSGVAAEGFSPEIIKRVMEALGPGLIGGGEGLAMARTELLKKTFDMTDEQADYTLELIRTFNRSFKRLNKNALHLSQQFISGDDTLREMLIKIRATGEGFNELKPALIKKLAKANKDLFDNEQDLNAAVERLVDAASDNVDLLLKQGITEREYASGAFAKMGTMTKGRADLGKGDMKELIDDITPISKILNITKRSLKYGMTDNQIFRSINNWLHDIFDLITHIASLLDKVPFAKSFEEIQKEKEEKFLAKDFEKYALLQEEAAKSIISISEKQQEIKGLGKEKGDEKKIRALNEEISAEKEALRLAQEQMSDIEKRSGKEKELTSNRMVSIQELIKGMESGDIKGERSRLDFLQNMILEALGRNPKDRSFQWDVIGQGFIYNELMNLEQKAAYRYKKRYGKEPKTSIYGPMADFRALSEGMVKVSRGDVVVNAGSLAKGLGGGVGQFANQVISKSNMDGIGGAQHNWGGINIVFQAPADSTNPNAYKRMFVDAVEQIVDRKMYAEKQRIS